MENQRAVFQRRQLQFPTRYQLACKIDTPQTFSELFYAAEERNASRTKSPRGRSPSGRIARLPCKDYFKGTCANSFCENGILQNVCSTSRRMDADLGKSALMRIARFKNSLAKGPKKNGDKSAVAMLKKHELHDRTERPVVYDHSSNTRQMGCVFQGMEPPKSSSILRKSSDTRKLRCVKFTKAVVRHADIRDQNPSLGMICPGEPHQRDPNAPKFEDRSQEERVARAMCP